jgi:hypothetical protein
MKLWSRGLGKQEIYMDFRYCETIKDPETGNVIIIGNMRSPVTWEFKITFHPEDIGGILKMLFSRSMFMFAFRNLYQYLVYLMNRSTYRIEGSLVERVNSSYEQCMTGGRVFYRGQVSVPLNTAGSKEV